MNSRTKIKTVNCQLSNQRYSLTAVLETEVHICFNFPVKCTKFQTGQIAKLQSVLLRVVTVTAGLCAQDCNWALQVECKEGDMGGSRDTLVGGHA